MNTESFDRWRAGVTDRQAGWALTLGVNLLAVGVLWVSIRTSGDWWWIGILVSLGLLLTGAFLIGRLLPNRRWPLLFGAPTALLGTVLIVLGVASGGLEGAFAVLLGLGLLAVSLVIAAVAAAVQSGHDRR